MVCRFLLVSLVIDAVLGEVTVSERRRKLDEMTVGNHLGDAYATTLARMKAQKGGKPRLGMEALMWVSNSERPLHTSELCQALGVKIGSADLDHENTPEIRTILRCSLGLITVDASSSTVRLVHFTLQEYLSNSNLFQSPHSMIAEVCLTYLNFRCARALSPTLDPAPLEFPFLQYASCYWGNHLREDKTENAIQLALGLLVGFEEHISSQLLLRHYDNNKNCWEPRFDSGLGLSGFSGLHGGAFLGVVEIVVSLLAMKEWDINAADAMDQTALAWAAARGHGGIVAVLLQLKEVNPNTADTWDCGAPLWWAARVGHEGVVKLLLEREDINPNTADTRYGRTPLWWAATDEGEGVIKLLLEREDIDPNTADTRYGRTPLWRAARYGHEGVVKLLLEREDINPNTADTEYGQTPLWRAAEGGREGVVKLLLEREDIDPNAADTKYGQTPLWRAARYGHEDVVKLLLEREDIDPNAADTKYGQPPLRRAARYGREGVVKLLLAREDTNPNTAGTQHGETPLLWAAARGHEGVVKLLLEREDTNPNTSGTQHGETPLLWAAASGYAGVAKLLLEREDTNPNTADLKYGQTPLLWAAQRGLEEVVKLLLEREDINPNIADTIYGRTPLMWAAIGGHWGIVKLLSEREYLNRDIPGLSGETALELAESREHAGVVQFLPEPTPFIPIPIPTKKAPECLSASLPPQKLLLSTQLRLVIAILSFAILLSSIFLFYFLGISLLAMLPLSFHG